MSAALQAGMVRWLVLVAVWSWTAQAYSLRKDAAGSVVRWRGAVEFVVDEASVARWNVPGAKDAIHAALNTWAAAVKPGLHVSVRDGAARAVGVDLAQPQRNQNDVIVVFDWPYADSALATTLVTYDAKKATLVDTDVLINAEHHAFAVVGFGERSEAYDVQNTLTHELGHALGLMHNDEDEAAVMFPSAPVGQTGKRLLTSDDVEGATALYGAPDAATPEVEADVSGTVGCSTTGSSAGLLALALVLSWATRRRAPAFVVVAARRRPARKAWRSAALTLALLGGAAWAQPQERVRVRGAEASLKAGLITTTLALVPEGCSADCPVTSVVVPGGRVGDLVQEVVDHPVPQPGEPLVLLRVGGRLKLLRPDRQPADAQGLRPGQQRPKGAAPTLVAPPQPLTSPTSVPGSAFESENAHGPATTSNPDRR